MGHLILKHETNFLLFNLYKSYDRTEVKVVVVEHLTNYPSY